jgi:hypothetical protein
MSPSGIELFNLQCGASINCTTAWPRVSNNIIYFKQTKLNDMRYNNDDDDDDDNDDDNNNNNNNVQFK